MAACGALWSCIWCGMGVAPRAVALLEADYAT
jgi:hypothetical protein